jgi:hypothetical protein
VFGIDQESALRGKNLVFGLVRLEKCVPLLITEGQFRRGLPIASHSTRYRVLTTTQRGILCCRSSMSTRTFLKYLQLLQGLAPRSPRRPCFPACAPMSSGLNARSSGSVRLPRATRYLCGRPRTGYKFVVAMRHGRVINGALVFVGAIKQHNHIS